jgi:hypothetical protein
MRKPSHVVVLVVIFWLMVYLLLWSSPPHSTPVPSGPYGFIAGQTWSSGCPAEQVIPGQSPPPCGSPYPNFQVAIYDVNTGQMVRSVISDSQGKFQVAVPQGIYVVYTKVVSGYMGGPTCAYPATYSPTWLGCATGPVTLTVSAGQTVSVTVNIPNGIQ